jgi:hypothetical protein
MQAVFVKGAMITAPQRVCRRLTELEGFLMKGGFGKPKRGGYWVFACPQADLAAVFINFSRPP